MKNIGQYKVRNDTVDISNKIFCDLTVLHPIIKPKGKRGVYWLCQCKCGKQCVAQGGHLRNGSRKSCGCWSEKRIEETGIKIVLHSYVLGASRRNRPWNLSFEQFGKLIKQNCFYCGRPPFTVRKRQKSRKPQIIYNGIDQFDHTVGYTIENCVTSCMDCNRAKGSMSFQDFKEHIKRIYKWLTIDS